MLVNHIAPHTTSEQVYKGVLNGRSRGVFHGSITVQQTAQKTNAKQSDKNLLLSDEAEVDTKPALWIYADDVRCGHGAACGKLDDGALFYLQSRGIDEATARRMLVHGFANEVLDYVDLTPLRVHLEQLITATLRASERTRMTAKPFDVEAVRRDFPILSREVGGKPLVYLDSAATSPEAADGHRCAGGLLHRHERQHPPRRPHPQPGGHRGLRGRAHKGAPLHQRR